MLQPQGTNSLRANERNLLRCLSDELDCIETVISSKDRRETAIHVLKQAREKLRTARIDCMHGTSSERISALEKIVGDCKLEVSVYPHDLPSVMGSACSCLEIYIIQMLPMFSWCETSSDENRDCITTMMEPR